MPCLAQNKDSVKGPADKIHAPAFTIGGYVDAYVAAYTDSVGPGKYQKFPAISPRSNSFGLNIMQVTGQYTSEKIRSTATLQFGDLPSAAWSPVFNFIQEANVGVRLSKKIWIDAGFFKTHIGTEALLPKDNITSSISVITFYEPWWQSGIKFSYNPSDKFQMAIFLENGYNEYIATNKKKAVGMVFNYTLGTKASIGYYNFIGDATPDSIKTHHMRFLNNLVFTYQLCEKFKMILGLDYIMQQNSNIDLSFTPPIDYNTSTVTTGAASAYSIIFTLKYQPFEKFGVYGRFEDFQDPQGFLSQQVYIPGNSLLGYELMGETLGIEYKPMENSYIRLEGRELEMNEAEKIFYIKGAFTNNRGELMLCIGAWF
jgi:hypothetical protein